MLDGLRYVTIPDVERHQTILVCYPPPKKLEDPWGPLSPLRGTTWGAQIPTVTGEALSHALHGRPKPLREMLGPPPRSRALRIALEERVCLEQQLKICGQAGPFCYPGSTKMPRCYVAPTTDERLKACATAVALAWDEGRYVFVVEGEEFVVT